MDSHTECTVGCESTNQIGTRLDNLHPHLNNQHAILCSNSVEYTVDGIYCELSFHISTLLANNNLYDKMSLSFEIAITF